MRGRILYLRYGDFRSMLSAKEPRVLIFSRRVRAE
jgi:hypothetical protein